MEGKGFVSTDVSVMSVGNVMAKGFVNTEGADINVVIVMATEYVSMVSSAAFAKCAVDHLFVNTGDSATTARSAGAVRFVSMAVGNISAKIVEGRVCVSTEE